MSRFFGDLIQIGYVVTDIEATMHHWVDELGVGPWFYIEHLSVPDFMYMGKRSPVDLSLAMANSGFIQIELIHQHNYAPSMYMDFLDHASEGVQHLGYGTYDFFTALKDARAAGYLIAQQGTGGSRGPFAYLDTEDHVGTVVELIDLAHGRKELFAGIAAAALGWDGKDPIRIKLPI